MFLSRDSLKESESMSSFAKYRDDAHLSLNEVEQLLKLSGEIVAEYERGTRVPSAREIQILKSLSLRQPLRPASERVEMRADDDIDTTTPAKGLSIPVAKRNARTSAKQKLRSGRAVSPIYLDVISEIESNVVYLRPRRGGKRIAFGWYGGKFSHLDWLLPLLPKCHHYCEPFAGSAAVLLNRAPSPVETYNDLDGDVVNFFRILRERSEELVQAIQLTPFSREEFHQAITGSIKGISDLERARRFYIRARQTRTGLAQTASLGRWANCKNTSRAGMSGVVSRWMGGVEALPEIADRFLRVQIENRPAVDVIKLYDSPDTFFYCDPPYLHATRGDSKAYGFEMTDAEHQAFANVLNSIKGKAAVSGYRNKQMDKLFRGWRRFDAPEKMTHSIKQVRQECLWMNY
jgi:DNA adenine methylase